MAASCCRCCCRMQHCSRVPLSRAALPLLPPPAQVGIQFGAGGGSSATELAGEGRVDAAWAIRRARACLDAGAELVMIESEGAKEVEEEGAGSSLIDGSPEGGEGAGLHVAQPCRAPARPCLPQASLRAWRAGAPMWCCSWGMRWALSGWCLRRQTPPSLHGEVVVGWKGGLVGGAGAGGEGGG